MWLKHTAIILGIFALMGIQTACSKYRQKIHGPIINSEMQSQIVHLGTLHFGESLKGDLSKGPFLAYSFFSPSKAVIELTLKSVRRPPDAYMALYGPRADTGQFKESILVKLLDREKSGFRHQTAEGGEYLILIVHEKSAGGSYPYEITLRCLDGCQLPLCQTLDERGCPDLYCPTGIKMEEKGCLTCGCKTSELCGPGAISIGGKCIPDCICPVPYEPVCGADGITYGSPCEASCKGIEVIAKGTCLETCGPFMCDKSCLFGFKGDAKGCPLCECNADECRFCDSVYKPVCGSDGVTHLNMCRLTCAGARFLYYGPCRYPTCEVHCPVTCKTPLMACNKDCPFGVVVDMDNCHTCECYEPCRDTDACKLHQPVCAARIQDGKLYIRTFINGCSAECQGFSTLFKRVCPFMCENDMDCPLANKETATNPFFKCVSIYSLIHGIIDPGSTAGDVESPGICVFRFKELPCDLASPDPEQCPSGRICKNIDGKGLCVSRCKCGRILDPVCDVDGISYLNECDAFCAGKKIAHPGPCCGKYEPPPSGTGCTNGEYLDIYGCHTDICRVQKPLCGINCKADVDNPVCAEGEIYDNACLAHCEGHQTDIDYPVLDDGTPNPEVCE